ncbi:TetR family transcriptional regulator [Aeromicrobium sp. A1-2]|uniref:TetR/AcrR family transcriptional regulator n=1 Tax=Aeromicrobium sp. A1-2 TaxID=2107713 RepID=UPI000E553BF5|nr:TetR/AcrR family transcriptional regulator C-terminal domain-containing protein [Aeromicrobium sp. A1-2]AXT85753.1 TetR family transcriptional regulator [Aeromicrobium sp. A1-2]
MTTREVRTPLSRERVLVAAIALADAEGMSAVTMRRLAADVGVEAMSLYHHVPGKAGLLDGLAEAVIVRIHAAVDAAVSADDDWRTAVRHRCLAARSVMVDHRWAPGLLGSRSSIPTSLYPYYEEILATMIRGGLGYHLAHQGIHALGTMVLGFTQELFTPDSEGGTLDEEAAEAELAAMAEMLPHLTAMVASEVHDAGEDPLGWCDSQNEFEFTLDLLLDGLARASDSLARHRTTTA